MSVSLKALTIWQPWASLITIGAKPYEFRGWEAPRWIIGQRIAIHAGARPVRMREVRDLIADLEDPLEVVCLRKEIALPFLRRVRAGLIAAKAGGGLFQPATSPDAPLTLPLSHIVCTAVIGAPKRGDACAREFGSGCGVGDANDSDREGTFNWGWPLTDVQPGIPPIPARGAQGFWNWTGKAEAA